MATPAKARATVLATVVEVNDTTRRIADILRRRTKPVMHPDTGVEMSFSDESALRMEGRRGNRAELDASDWQAIADRARRAAALLNEIERVAVRSAENLS